MPNHHKIISALIFIVVVVFIIFGIKIFKQDKNNTRELQTSLAPWPAEIAHLSSRLSAIGLPALSQEGTALHIHQHLDIFIHGKAIPVPAGIGINQQAPFISPIHTHDTSGVIHVESPTLQTFTLGQFFDIWGVRFNQNSVGGYTNDGSSILTLYINGQKFVGDARTIELASHQEIVITFGTTAEQPQIPSSFKFSSGE
jgi:hypothetical protein